MTICGFFVGIRNKTVCCCAFLYRFRHFDIVIIYDVICIHAFSPNFDCLVRARGWIRYVFSFQIKLCVDLFIRLCADTLLLLGLLTFVSFMLLVFSWALV